MRRAFIRMTRFVTTIVILCTAAFARAGGAPGLTEHESPRATDLLRAKRLAERAQSRLRTPRAGRRGWAHGGDGWNAPPKPADHDPRVVINVGGRKSRVSGPTPVD